MLNIINISERHNILKFDEMPLNVVANSDNFYLKFELDEEWSECALVTCVFLYRGQKVCEELDEDKICKIPAFDEGRVSFSIRAGIGEDETISSTMLELNILKSGDSDLSNVPDYQVPHTELLGIIEDLRNGNIKVAEAETADSSLSQVGLTGDDEISGTKNFVGNLQKNGTNVATINQISNPNLLINGDFRVNQRGQDSYTNDTSALKYTVDRWRMSLGNTGLNGTVITPKQNGGINICCSDVYAGGATPFIQLIENPQNLIGKTLTFSIYCSAIASGSCRFRLSNNITYATGNLQVGINQISYTVPEGTTQLFCGIICNSTTAFNIDLDYAKLEIGSIATPFSPRPYAEELANCQRYLQKFKPQTLRCDLYTTTQVLFTLPTPVTLRNHYTLNLGENSGIQATTGGSVNKTWTFSTLTPVPDNCVKIKAIPPSGVTPTDCVLNIQSIDSFVPYIDAEIY